MYKITNTKFTKNTYVCVHGQLINGDDSIDLSSENKHFFMKIEAGYYTSTPRQEINQFDTEQQLKSAFPGKIKEINDALSLQISETISIEI